MGYPIGHPIGRTHGALRVRVAPPLSRPVSRPVVMAPGRKPVGDKARATGGAGGAAAGPPRLLGPTRVSGKGETANAAARAKSQARARSSLEDGSDEDDSGVPSGEDSYGADSEDAEEEQPMSLWALKGTLAGRLATDKARKSEEYVVEAPQAVVDAGAQAEMAWLTAFSKTFKPATTSPVREDRRLSGLTISKRRRLSSKPEPNKTGRAGLDESAEAVVSTAVYAWVRSDFFLPADHLRLHIRACVKDEGFDASDKDVDAWWEAKGHSMALAKAKSARHSIVEALKCGVWLAHGAFFCACSQPG